MVLSCLESLKCIDTKNFRAAPTGLVSFGIIWDGFLPRVVPVLFPPFNSADYCRRYRLRKGQLFPISLD